MFMTKLIISCRLIDQPQLFQIFMFSSNGSILAYRRHCLEARLEEYIQIFAKVSKEDWLANHFQLCPCFHKRQLAVIFSIIMIITWFQLSPKSIAVQPGRLRQPPSHCPTQLFPALPVNIGLAWPANIISSIYCSAHTGIILLYSLQRALSRLQ